MMWQIMNKRLIRKEITLIILVLLCTTSTILIEDSITKAKSIDKQINPNIEQNYLSSGNDGDIFGPFEYETSLKYYFGMITQEGVASDDKGTFFISTARWANKGKITVAKRDTWNTFGQKEINGISELDIGWHIGDPFCDDKYLIVPKSDWNIHNPVPDKAECRVFYLDNLTELPGSPYGLKKYGKYIPGASSGAYYDGYYYFSTYNEGYNIGEKKESKLYKFSFNPDIGFSYEGNYFLGKTEVQGIEIFDDKCYFIRSHGSDPNVYWIDINNWGAHNLGKQNLQVLSNYENGPYEGITFDTSDDKTVAYFGFGGDKILSFFHTNTFEFSNLDCSGSLNWEEKKPGSNVYGEFTIENIGDPNTNLNWDISDYPDWGNWSFNPINGSNLKPEDGKKTVEVNVSMPNKKSSSFEGKIKIINKNNENDYCTINVVASTPKQKPLQKIESYKILRDYPIISGIIQYLLK